MKFENIPLSLFITFSEKKKNKKKGGKEINKWTTEKQYKNADGLLFPDDKIKIIFIK